MEQYFYDTSALLNLGERAFEKPFGISMVTLYELERIKTSASKDLDIKAKARAVTRLLRDTEVDYTVYDIPPNHATLETFGLQNDDWLIVHTAKFQRNRYTFVTDDLSLANIAKRRFQIKVKSSAEIGESVDHYTGVIVVEPDDIIMEKFHEDLAVNSVNCLVNQYAFLKGNDKTAFGYRWNGKEYVLVYGHPLDSNEFGKVNAKDMYQRAAIDSIMNNMVTCISGPPGSGKSLLSLAGAFDLIRRKKFDRVVMLVNPAKANGAVDLGYYPGTVEEKLLATFAGNMLRSKFGHQCGIEQLMASDKLRLISMSDIRGMEITEDEILYIPECQNTTVVLLKLCLSRVCDGAKVIFEGDFATQVDSTAFSGSSNGMKRAVDVLKGSPLFGYVELQHVWRSKLGAYIDKM